MFSGKYYWLIGASEGIGEALAVALSRAGANLILSARNAEKLAVVLANLAPRDHRVVPLDVSDWAASQAVWATMSADARPVDGVIYNAGTYDAMDAEHMQLHAIERMVDINFMGAVRVMTLVVPYMLVRNAGHIALVGSVAGYRGLPAAIGYGASKAALIHFAENLKADLARTALKIQIINPGFVATRLTAKNDFRMPFMVTVDKAAAAMMAGLQSKAFEIHFPKRFSRILKFLSHLPDCLYFPLLRSMKM